MKQILTITCLLIVLMLGTVGCMVIFNVMSMEAAQSAVLRFGGAIILLGVCSALVMMLMGRSKGQGD